MATPASTGLCQKVKAIEPNPDPNPNTTPTGPSDDSRTPKGGGGVLGRSRHGGAGADADR